MTAAASGINLGSLFRGYFERSDPNGANGTKPAVNLTESQVETLNKSGAVLNQSVTDKGTTVTVKAAVGDKSGAYILLDVTAPEGTVLDRDDYDFEEMPIDFHVDNTKKKGGEGFSISWDIFNQKDENPSDNQKAFVLRISSAGLDLQGREIGLSLVNLSTQGKKKLTFDHVVEGQWNLNFKLDYSSDTKDLAVDKEAHYTGYTSTIKNISLSPLSAAVTSVYEENSQSDKSVDVPPLPDLIVAYRDGTTQTIQQNGPGSGGKNGFTSLYCFDAPIELSNVASIALGDLTIPIS